MAIRSPLRKAFALFSSLVDSSTFVLCSWSTIQAGTSEAAQPGETFARADVRHEKIAASPIFPAHSFATSFSQPQYGARVRSHDGFAQAGRARERDNDRAASPRVSIGKLLYSTMRNSTRRLSWRPASVRFDALGLRLP